MFDIALKFGSHPLKSGSQGQAEDIMSRARAPIDVCALPCSSSTQWSAGPGILGTTSPSIPCMKGWKGRRSLPCGPSA